MNTLIKKMASIALLSAAVLTFTACEDEVVVVPQPVVEIKIIKNLQADAAAVRTNKFTLFSLASGQTVANADSATNKWDIGFRGTNIIINGGAIRTGKGAAQIINGIFDELATAPDANYKTDESATALAIAGGSGNGWYNYDGPSNLITPLAGKIIVLRTADEKFAKLEILSYYENAPVAPNGMTDKSRYFTFRYSYQADGSKKLK